MTNAGKTIIFKTDNFVPLVVPGLPVILVAIRLQHRHCRVCLQQIQPESEVTD